MRQRLRILLAVLSFSLPAYPLTAELEFEAETIELKAAPEDLKSGGVFRFINRGNDPITISEVKTSCGCTTADLEKKEYQPGESGEIEAFLTIGNRRGQQRKRIQVFTDSPKERIHSLTLVVDIPEILVVQPRMLVWRRSEPNEPKTITAKIVHDGPFRINSVDAPDDDFRIEYKLLDSGRRCISPQPHSRRNPLLDRN